MKTSTSVAALLGCGLIACSEDVANPVAPSGPGAALDSAAAAPPRTMAGFPGAAVAGSPASSSVAGTPAVAGVRGISPGTGSGFNAYWFEASWAEGNLRLVLVEDEMTGMREASKPHRHRLIEVDHCPREPHHVLQRCARLWKGRLQLTGRLALDPIPLDACDGWIVVQAAELSDDRLDGWRNAPCPSSGDGEIVSSDGRSGPWPDYPSADDDGSRGDGSGDGGPAVPAGEPFSPRVSSVDLEVNRGSNGRYQVNVADLFPDTAGSSGRDFRAESSRPSVVEVVGITDNPHVVLRPLEPGTAIIIVDDLRNGVQTALDAESRNPLPIGFNLPASVQVPCYSGSALPSGAGPWSIDDFGEVVFGSVRVQQATGRAWSVSSSPAFPAGVVFGSPGGPLSVLPLDLSVHPVLCSALPSGSGSSYDVTIELRGQGRTYSGSLRLVYEASAGSFPAAEPYIEVELRDIVLPCDGSSTTTVTLGRDRILRSRYSGHGWIFSGFPPGLDYNFDHPGGAHREWHDFTLSAEPIACSVVGGSGSEFTVTMRIFDRRNWLSYSGTFNLTFHA